MLVASLTPAQYTEMLKNKTLRRYAPYRQALARLTRKEASEWNSPNGSSTPRRRSPGKLAASDEWSKVLRELSRHRRGN